MPQLPPEQVADPLAGVGQTCPHEPQFLGSVLVFTQEPLQTVSSPSPLSILYGSFPYCQDATTHEADLPLLLPDRHWRRRTHLGRHGCRTWCLACPGGRILCAVLGKICPRYPKTKAGAICGPGHAGRERSPHGC
jgi:hypothetical protein